MKLKVDIILMLILIAIPFSGYIGIESENVMQDPSGSPLNSSSPDFTSFIDLQPLPELISIDNELHGGGRNSVTPEISIPDTPVKYASVNDIEVGYREFGSGEPILMIAPFASTMDMWNVTFVEQLACSYRVIIFDNRGMGHSSGNNTSITMPLLVNDTKGLMDVLELDSAHIFGTSMGAVIAQELALGHSGKVDKLILSSSTYSLDVPQTELLKSRLRYRASDNSTDQMIRKYAEGNLVWNGTYERLPEIQNKMLLLAGNEDILTPPELSIMISEQVPGAEVVQFEGVGHLGEQYLPEEYADTILWFLASE